MTNFDYNLNIPNGPDNPSADWPLMQTNTNSTSQIIGVDHVTFETNNGGYHTDIHMIPQAPPSAISGIGQLFTQNVTVNSITDTQLFFQTGITGGLSQLTGNHASINGYQWLGGILIQWGYVTGISGSFFQVPFNTPNINFPNACFNVILTPSRSITAPSLQNANTMYVNQSSLAGLNPPNQSSFWIGLAPSAPSGGIDQAYWIAIGN